jgi:predicted nucleic acid-binding Zn ribbon protein
VSSDDDDDVVPSAPATDATDSTDRAPVAPGADPDVVPVSSPHDLARAALKRAQAAARSRGLRPGRPLPGRFGSPGAVGGPASGSGSHPSRRDPAPIGDSLHSLMAERGWTEEVSVGGVIGRWREVVGTEMADHCTPETFEEGVLVVRTDSTSWATQVRLLVPQLLARLAKDVGPNVVREVKVLGPVGPGWRRGNRSVPGRGPRDTYG